MAIINTNLTSLISQQHLSKSKAALATSMERLSSGLRINSAKDDAAGQGIANRMQANINAHSAIARGINDGISLMQTAEGGLDSINKMLQRGRELAIQAATGTLSDSDRAAIQNEFLQIREQIDYISKNTEAFGKTPLAAPLSEAVLTPEEVPDQVGNVNSIRDIDPKIGESQLSGLVPLGFIPQDVINFIIEVSDFGLNDDIQIFTQDGKHLVGTSIQPGSTWSTEGVSTVEQLEQQVFTSENGFLESARYDDSSLLDGSGFFDLGSPQSITFNEMTLTYSGNGNNGNSGDSRDESLSIDKITEPLFVMVTGQGYFSIEAFSWEDAPPSPTPPILEPVPTSGPVDIVTSAGVGNDSAKTMTVKPSPSDSETLGIAGVDLSQQESASEALSLFDRAMKAVDGYRSQYGALTNRFEGVIENHRQQEISMSAAQSRIQDADYAVETASMAKAQILQQAGTSVLAQANQIPQNVLSLLS